MTEQELIRKIIRRVRIKDNTPNDIQLEEDIDALIKEAGYVKLADDQSLPEDTIEDGFGSVWSAFCPMCGKKSMSVVRPGKVQCGNCG